MMDIAALVRIHEKLYSSMVSEVFGDSGSAALQKLLQFIHNLYRYLPIEHRKEPLIVLKTLDDKPANVASAFGEVYVLDGFSHASPGPLIVQVLDSGKILIWHSSADAVSLASDAVVYVYNDRQEWFYAKTRVAHVDKISPAYASNFALPIFDELHAALQHYETRLIRHSACPIFHGCWYDDKRIFFHNGPEEEMRDSLTNFLHNHMRGDVEIRPEQNVTDTNPVDIKVTWFNSNRLALIEIKWLGKSRTKKKITADYTESRARAGAEQLADYLDKNKPYASIQVTRGYLVVIDARRGKTNLSTIAVTTGDGLKYASLDIDYAPKYHQIRTDFEVPFRMFAEPVIG